MQQFWQLGLHFLFCLYSAGLSFCVVALSLYTFPLGYFLEFYLHIITLSYHVLANIRFYKCTFLLGSICVESGPLKPQV